LIRETRVDPAIPEVADLDLAIERRRVLPEVTRERFVDDGHRRRAGYVGVAKITAAAKRDAERGEISRRDDPQLHRADGELGMVRDVDRKISATFERQAWCDGRLLHAG